MTYCWLQQVNRRSHCHWRKRGRDQHTKATSITPEVPPVDSGYCRLQPLYDPSKAAAPVRVMGIFFGPRVVEP